MTRAASASPRALALPAGRWLDRADSRLVFTLALLTLAAADVLAALGWGTVPPAAPAPGGRRLPVPDRRLLADAALLGTAVTAALLALAHGGRHPVPAAALAAGAVALGVWWVRLPASRPVTSLVRRPALGLPALALLGNTALVGLTSFSLPFFISDVLGRSPELIGTAVGVFVVVSALVTPLAGMLADRFDPRSVAAAGGGLTVLAMVPMLTLDAGAGLLDVTWRLCLVGAAMSVFNPPT